jgi:hypothetical protein
MIEYIPGHLLRSIATALAVCSTVALPSSLLVAASKHRNEPARPDAGVPAADNPGVDFAALVAQSMSAASARNEAALGAYTSKISRILDCKFSELREAARPTAKAVATSRNCLRLIALLASDTVRGRSDAENLVRKRITVRLGPQVDDCQRQIQDVIDEFDRELSASTLTLATELAEIWTSAATSLTLGHQPVLERLALNQALRHLGLDGVILPPALAIDVYSLPNNRVCGWLITRTMEIAKWIFARPIAAATAEATCVVVDGPLPFGDAIALIGAVWTAHDVCTLRHRFKRELATAIEEGLAQARVQIENDVLAALRDQVMSHMAVQARIHDETERSFLKRTH